MSNRIDVSFQVLQEQSADAVDYYLDKAVHSIDGRFGEGFAQKNPDLVASLVASAISEFHSAAQLKVYGSALDSIASALEKIAYSRQ